jgi:hypothetical protein
MTDQLDDLFRDLRADTLTTVRPPGVPAARRTLHRRRRNRTVGAAACLVVAGAGGLGAHLLGPMQLGRMGGDVGDRPFRAASAIGSTAEARFSGQGAAQTATVARGRVLAGHYTLTLSCFGRGRLSLTIRIGGAEMGEAAVWCGTGGAVVSRPVTVPDPLTVTAELRAEHGAAGRAGYAYSMVLSAPERADLVRAATEALPAAGPGTPVSGLHDSTVVPTTLRLALTAGVYRLAHSCAGMGRVTVLLRPAAEPSETSLSCEERAAAADITFFVRQSGTVQLDVMPDGDADHQSAYQVRVERV